MTPIDPLTSCYSPGTKTDPDLRKASRRELFEIIERLLAAWAEKDIRLHSIHRRACRSSNWELCYSFLVDPKNRKALALEQLASKPARVIKTVLDCMLDEERELRVVTRLVFEQQSLLSAEGVIQALDQALEACYVRVRYSPETGINNLLVEREA